ncbi:DUF4232 domain-containing protein [Cryobacterium sp. Hz7]|nr:DUF4232 domain-containing protein [Cryobacterium sp. Hz7]
MLHIFGPRPCPWATTPRQCETGAMTVMRGRGRSMAVGLGCAAALVLAGCAGPGSPPTGDVSPPGSTPTAASTPTSPATQSSTPAPADSASAGTCGPNQLALSLQSRPQDSGMGNFYWDLRLTNTGPAACTVEGYPVTTLVGAAPNVPVGSASDTEPGRWYPVAVLALAPGTSAYSLLHLGQAGACGCPLVPVGALDVTLPGWDTASRVATPNPIEGCDDDSTVLVRTGPLAPAPVSF